MKPKSEMYRTVKVSMWTDSWFLDLSPHGKLLFMYLFTNGYIKPCGVAEIHPALISAATGLAADQLNGCMEEIGEKVVSWAGTYFLWVKTFYANQRACAGETFTIAARNSLVKFPAIIRDTVIALYPELAPINKEGARQKAIPYTQNGDTLSPKPAVTVEQNNSKTVDLVSDSVLPTSRPPAHEAPPEPIAETVQPVAIPAEPRAVPKPSQRSAGFDFGAYWLLYEADTGEPPLRKDRECETIKVLLGRYPEATPDDFACFLRYKRQIPRSDPLIEATLTFFQNDFGKWYHSGRPEQPEQRSKPVERKPTAAERDDANHAAILARRAARRAGRVDNPEPGSGEFASANTIELGPESYSMGNRPRAGTNGTAVRSLPASSVSA